MLLPRTEGYESLSEIRLSAKKRNALRLLLADTRLRDENEHDMMDSFITRVQDISGQLPSNRCVGVTWVTWVTWVRAMVGLCASLPLKWQPTAA
jgi:hypothetical protein